MALSKHSGAPAQFNRRHLLTAAPAFGFGALMAAGAVPALSGEIILPAARTVPFLHELTAPALGLDAGDMVLIIPGLARWDDTHLLHDGRFAAVQVFTSDDLVAISVHGGERIRVSRAQAADIVAGRVDKKLRVAVQERIAA